MSSEQNNDKLSGGDSFFAWRKFSTIFFALATSWFAFKHDVNIFYAIILYFPAAEFWDGLFANNMQKCCKALFTLIVFPVLIACNEPLCNALLAQISSKMKPLLISGIKGAVFFGELMMISPFIKMAVKALPDFRLPANVLKVVRMVGFLLALSIAVMWICLLLNLANEKVLHLSPNIGRIALLVILAVALCGALKMLYKVYWSGGQGLIPSGGHSPAVPDAPKSPEKIIAPTRIKKSDRITFNDVAGMDEVKKQLKLRLIDPVRNPRAAAKYGLKAGGGVMLYGPPGTGKTFIARAVAGELNLPFYMITGADIFGKYVGDAEKNVTNIFAEARKNPLSVVFVDEMETIFSKRTDDIHEVTRKVISIILQELDGVDKSKNPILLLGATNTPWQIDEAFMRPGRFDVLTYVGLPDAAARKQIFTNSLKKSEIRLERGVVDYLTLQTENYSGADIKGVLESLRQTAFEYQANSYSKALAQEVLSKSHPSGNHSVIEKIRKWEAERFNTATDDLALQERPEVKLDDVAGMDNVKEQIRLRLIEPIRNPKLAAMYDLKPGGGVLLYGPPGTGKTFVARAVAGELNLPFYTITSADIFGKYVGEAENNIRNIFANARKNPLSVVFVDEMETIFAKRSENIHETTQKVISVVLQELDGVDKSKNPILLLGATNTPWQIDEAFLRPGRFDILAYVGLPNIEARWQILRNLFKQSQLPCEKGLLEYITQNTDSYSGADLKGLVEKMRQKAFVNRDKYYSMKLAYQVMLDNVPSSKKSIIEEIRRWEATRK